MKIRRVFLATLLSAGLAASLASADENYNYCPSQEGNACYSDGSAGCRPSCWEKFKALFHKGPGVGITIGNGGGSAGSGATDGNQPPPKILAFPNHPYARSPRDFFMMD
jgi:hypothetical protein